MPHYLIRLERDCKEWFLEWSTIVDAPVTFGMSEAELLDHIRFKYGNDGISRLPERLARVRRNGCSCLPEMNLEDLLAYNRAGKGETTLTTDEIIDDYCKPQPPQPGEDDAKNRS